MFRARAVVVFMLTLPHVEHATYRVDPDESRIVVEVGRSGLFKMLGHDHRIEASGLSGEAKWNAEAPESSHFVLVLDASTLTVVDDEVSDDDRAKIQAEMETKALALPDHPTIRFESETVRLRSDAREASEVELEGTLSLRGVEKKLRVPLTLSLDGAQGKLRATGELELASSEWGVPQIAAVGGGVKTKEKLEIRFEIVAVR